MPFLVLIYRLCMEAKEEVSLRIDPIVVALHTIDPILIKAGENPMELCWAQPPPMTEIFMPEP